jgi:uncharacterized membrane protein
MPQKAASPPAYPATSIPLALAPSLAPRDWMLRYRLLSICQKPSVRYGGGVAALVFYAGVLALKQPHFSLWAMAAIFIAALTSSIAGFAFSAICGAMLFHLLDDPVHVVEIMMIL